MRRPNVEWITTADDRILEIMGETNLQLSPKILAAETPFHKKHIQKRLRVLLMAGLVSKEGKGLYRITDLGRRYLTGEATADEIPDTNVE